MNRRKALFALLSSPFVAKAVVETKISSSIVTDVADSVDDYHAFFEGAPYFDPMGITRYTFGPQGIIRSDYLFIQHEHEWRPGKPHNPYPAKSETKRILKNLLIK